MVERCLVAVGILHFPVTQALNENIVGFLQSMHLLRCYIPQDADSQSRTGERMTGNQMFGHSQFASHAAYFVLEQPLQRFAQTEVHLLGQTAHVVMALDGLARNV